MKKLMQILFISLLLGVTVFSSKAFAIQVARPLPGKDFYALKYRPGGEGKRYISSLTGSGRIRGLLVVNRKRFGGVVWVGARTPWRPNKNVYWTKEKSIILGRVDEKIVIDLSQRRLSLYNRQKRIFSTKAVVGKPSTPTPRGLFALNDFYRVGGDLRPFVFQTTAHSRVIRRWKGGEARVALHGRHGSLRAPLGTARSNGCIRLPDWALWKIRKRATVGMPIRVRV